jgi:aryl-alcohol dehydrogenase-like predicted oxidoreductase
MRRSGVRIPEAARGFDSNVGSIGGQLVSRLVLGGASLGKFPQSDADVLLNSAHECGIEKIDTSPGYGESEKRIGSFLKGRSVFAINSKVGMPDPSLFTPLGIRVSVENSLRDLGIEQIETLFIHSLNKVHFTDENVAVLARLKEDGKVAQIGYSGDGDNLHVAAQMESFDDFMMTFNIIDQSNQEILDKLPTHHDVYFKIPLAHGIWRSITFDRRVASLRFVRKVFKKPPLPVSWLDYRNRFMDFKSEIKSKDYATEFLKFALFSGDATQYVVLGTNNPLHIQDAVRIESQKPDKNQVSSYLSLWKDKSKQNWQAHM